MHMPHGVLGRAEFESDAPMTLLGDAQGRSAPAAMPVVCIQARQCPRVCAFMHLHMPPRLWGREK